MTADNTSVGPCGNAPAARPVSLSDATARGFAWFFVQTVGNKVIAVLAQILLARILVPAEFGEVSLAYALAGFACILQQLNIGSILVQRPSEFGRLANAAFWMSLTAALVSAAALLICAPFASHIYRSNNIIWLLIVLAINQPLNSLSIVHTSLLQIELRFRELAAINLVVGFLISVLSVSLAWLGFGAMAMLLPLPITAVVRLVYVAIKVRAPLSLGLDLRYWRELFGDGALMLGIMLFYAVTAHGCYITLGLLFPNKEIVGTYYFAFNLSIQLMALISVNLAGTLLPVLSRLQEDPGRQIRGFLRVSTITTMVVVPTFVFQAVLSGPLIRLVFGSKWLAAIPVLQALSLAMTLQCVVPLTTSLLQAQRRLRECLLWWACLAPLFVGLVFVGAKLAAAVGCAVAVIIFSAVSGPGGILYAIRGQVNALPGVGGVFVRPLLLSLVAAGVPACLAYVSGVAANDLAYLAVVVIPGASAYVLMVRRLMPEQWKEVVSRFPRRGRRIDQPVAERPHMAGDDISSV